MQDTDECLRAVIADVRQALDKGDWTAAYVRLLALTYCDRAEGCANRHMCEHVREVFDRNIKRVTAARLLKERGVTPPPSMPDPDQR